MSRARVGRSTTAAAAIAIAIATALNAQGGARAASGPASASAPGSAPLIVPVAAVPDPLTIEVLTFGPGDHPFSRFGHNAIRVVNRAAGTDVTYNFGTFDGGAPNLMSDFLRGRLRYWLSRSSTEATLRAYEGENRRIEADRLDLPQSAARELVRRLEDNARPENRDYRYDYFRDNCSTRVRDAIDGVLGGRLHATSREPGALTLRDQALRMVAGDVSFYVALLIVLGPSTDRPIDEWTEAFLPEMLQRKLRGVSGVSGVSGASIAGDAARPLVSGERVLYEARRAPPRVEPPHWLPAFLAIGLVAGALLAWLGHASGAIALLRGIFGLIVAALGVGLGGIGCFLAGAWALTPHAVVYRNENVLLFAPFAIALGVFGVGAAMGSKAAARRVYLCAAAALGLAIAACLLKLFPWSRQENGQLILALLPMWLGLTLGARALTLRLG